LIVRIAERDQPFAQIDKRTLSDPRLPLEAKGMIAYLLTKPPGWKARIRDLVKQAGGSIRSVRRAMRELKACGYARVMFVRGAGGKFAGREIVIFERPDLSTEVYKNGSSATRKFRQTEVRFSYPISDNESDRITSNLSTQRTSNNEVPTRRFLLRQIGEKKCPARLVYRFCAQLYWLRQCTECLVPRCTIYLLRSISGNISGSRESIRARSIHSQGITRTSSILRPSAMASISSSRSYSPSVIRPTTPKDYAVWEIPSDDETGSDRK
jgi:hypothetical protein